MESHLIKHLSTLFRYELAFPVKNHSNAKYQFFFLQANSSFQSQFRDAELISTESKEFYASLKRDLCSSKESSGASGKKRKINPLFRNS